jgi:quercetin dioxygenase-like cupin family protein
MKKLLLVCGLVSVASASAAQTTKVTPLLSRELTDIAGKEGAMMTVEYAPGAEDPIHRHDAHVFVYVLEGSVVMQVKGAAPVTLHPGQTFYEGPNDIHLVGRNASKTEPAKFLALFVKNTGAPILMPVQ